MTPLIPLFGPVPGGMELVIVLFIAVLLFGANKIPKLARSTGEAIGEFKKGRQELEQELEEMTDPNADFSNRSTQSTTPATDTTRETETEAETESESTDDA